MQTCTIRSKLFVSSTWGVNFIKILHLYFHTKVFFAAFLYFHFGFEFNFFERVIGAKAAHKKLMKLITAPPTPRLPACKRDCMQLRGRLGTLLFFWRKKNLFLLVSISSMLFARIFLYKRCFIGFF